MVLAALAGLFASGANAQGQSARDSAEAAVWRFVAAGWGASFVSEHPAEARWICGPFRGTRCGPESVDAEFRSAMRDLDARSADTSSVPGILTLTGFSSRDTITVPGSCSGPSRMSLTRVGFDSTYTRAAVAYVAVSGTGAAPSCASASGATLLLRKRPDDQWEIVRRIGGWVS